MKTQTTWIFGLAALGLALAAPVQAAPNYMDDAFIVARNDKGNDARYDQGDSRKDKDNKDKRSKSRDEAEREGSQGYGYGYERRQQERNEEDSRPRGRR